jgi:hypothetical protein
MFEIELKMNFIGSSENCSERFCGHSSGALQDNQENICRHSANNQETRGKVESRFANCKTLHHERR